MYEVPPKNGFYFAPVYTVSGTVAVNAYKATYNAVTVSSGQTFVGIVGMSSAYIMGSTGNPMSMTINYTSPSAMVATSVNCMGNNMGFNGLFYASDCD